MKKYFLTTALMGTFIAPAFGADKIITSANTCTVDVLGVSDNNAVANTIATWDLIDYECPAGQYLLKSEGTLECTECPTGSYCPGGTYTVESENMGKNTCPADYTSDVAATAESECYMGCELVCTQQTCPEHSENCTHGVSSSTGKQYVDSTCNAEKTFCSIDFECSPGYNKIIANSEFIRKKGLFTEDISRFFVCGLNNQPEGDLDMVNEEFKEYGVILNNDSCRVTEPGTLIQQGNDGYSIKFQAMYNNHDINNYDVIQKTYSNRTSNDRIFAYSYDMDFSTEITGNHVWIRPVSLYIPTPIAEFVNSITEPYSETNSAWQKLRASVSETEFEAIKNLYKAMSMDSIEALQQITTENFWIASISATTTEVPLNYPWIYVGETSQEDKSVRYAIKRAQEYFYNESVPQGGSGADMFYTSYNGQYIYLTELFLPNNGAAYCMSNGININWDPDNGTDASQSMCVYGEELATPSDPVKPGYTFTGWKLVE